METSQTTIEKVKLFEGKLVLLRRGHSRYFHARTRVDGKRFQVSTKESTLRLAKEFATEWYLELLYKQKHNIPIHKHNFDEVVQDFLRSKKNDYRGKGERTEVAVNDYRKKCLVLSKFFHDIAIEDISPSRIEEYKEFRMLENETLSQNTLKHDFVVLRQLLKYSQRKEIISVLPIFPPLTVVDKVRSWFPPKEYQELLSVSRKRIRSVEHPRVKRDRQDLHNFIIFMVHTCLRVGECLSLRFKDVEIVERKPFKKSLLRISGIRGKTGKDGAGAGLFGAVSVLKRIMMEHPDRNPDDLIFPNKRYKSFRQLLEVAGLRYDQNDRERNAKSLRTTGIMYRCKNNSNLSLDVLSSHCRTSREMLERFYLKELSIRWTEDKYVAFDDDS